MPRSVPIAAPKARALRRPTGLRFRRGFLLRGSPALLRLLAGGAKRRPQVVEDEPCRRLRRRDGGERLLRLAHDEDAAVLRRDFELGQLRLVVATDDPSLLPKELGRGGKSLGALCRQRR